MPMRALRATSSFAGGHISKNLWLSAGICVALAIAAALLMQSRALGMRGLWGDATAFFASVAGILVMLQSQVGYVSSHIIDTADED